MNKEVYNIVKINFANGCKEFQNAETNLNIFYDGKIRAIARRAAGFYIQGFLAFSEKEDYGSSFMNHLRGLSNDIEIPVGIRNAADLLIMKMTNEELTGQKAINQAEIIIQFCKDEFIKYNDQDEK